MKQLLSSQEALSSMELTTFYLSLHSSIYLCLELLYELLLWIDIGDGPPSTSPSSSVDSANVEEGEVRPIEFDTALPVEHNVSIHVASDCTECGKSECVTWLVTCSVQTLGLF
jgi:hypothetical protein